MPQLKCPHCNESKNKVLDSRLGKRGGMRSVTDADNYIWRRNICHKCGERFTTIEITIETLDKLLNW
jgi:transcriptional regulator NrdR family protein